MRIHRVERGESVFGIARAYGVPAASIIEVNGLENPDALAVGQELLVLTPRRVYTARSGDTVSDVARRFGKVVGGGIAVAVAEEGILPVAALEVGLAIDFHGRVSPAMSIRLAELLKPYFPFFIEEPVLPENVDIRWFCLRMI